MAVNYAIGVPAFDLRLSALGRGRSEPYALVVAVADCNRTSEIAAGTRPEMRELRNRLLIALRSEAEVVDTVASAIAALARRLHAEIGALP